MFLSTNDGDDSRLHFYISIYRLAGRNMLDIKVRARAAAGERRYLIKIIAKLQFVSRPMALRLRNASLNPHQSGDMVAAKRRHSQMFTEPAAAPSLHLSSANRREAAHPSFCGDLRRRPGAACVAMAADIWHLPACLLCSLVNRGGVFGRSRHKLS